MTYIDRFPDLDHDERIEQLELRMRRLGELRDQLLKTGPEHFDQDSWFSRPEYEWTTERMCTAFDSDGGLDVEQLAEFPIDQCGATACLAGHGAILMASQKRRHIPISRHDVSMHFGIPGSWFDGQIPSYHPGADLLDKLAERGMPDHVAKWMCQLYGVQDAIDQYEQLRDELLDQVGV